MKGWARYRRTGMTIAMRVNFTISFRKQQVKASCYVFVGNGPGEGGCMLHNPHYDFNDRILPLGANYWSNLVQHILPAAA